MNKEEIISSGLLELYALGLTSFEETQEVESSLQLYPEITEELSAIELALESYARSFAAAPDGTIKDKILSRVIHKDGLSANNNANLGVEKPPARIYVIPTYFKLVAAAMIILLVGSIALNFSYYTKYQTASDDLQVAQEKMKQNEQANLAMKDDISIMSDKNSLPVVLKGTPHAPDALAKIYWMKNTGEVFVDPSNLPSVPEGKQYQLWAIVDGKPVDAGMISTEKGVYHIQRMKSFGSAQAFAITLEKVGGSPTPTMDEMYVVAKI